MVEKTGYENMTAVEEVVDHWSPIERGTTVVTCHPMLPNQSSRISPLHTAVTPHSLAMFDT